MRIPRIRSVGSALSWVAVSVGLVASAVVFSNADGMRQVSADGVAAVQIEQAMSGASALRNAVARAAILAESEASVDVDDLEAVRAEYGRRIGALLALDHEIPRRAIASASDELDSSVAELVAAFESGSPYGEILVAVDDAYRGLIDVLADERGLHVSELVTAGAAAGRAADVARFFVAVLLPLVLILGFVGRIRRIQMEDRLRWRIDQERAKRQANDEFIADLSHELRTPLTGIVGFANALRALQLPDEAREYVEIIATEGTELQRMVDDLVAVGRIQSGKVTYAFEEVDVVELVHAVVAPVRARGVMVNETLAPAMLWVDPGRFRQIVRNLVSNAVRYGGGSIFVLGEIETGEDGGRYRLSVIDDGPGVPDELVGRLFERYVHAGNAVTKGSIGLGLAIARAFAEGMGGELVYKREEGLTSFEVVVRLASGFAADLCDVVEPAARGAVLEKSDSTSRQVF